jgi:hypothetical protein
MVSAYKVTPGTTNASIPKMTARTPRRAKAHQFSAKILAMTGFYSIPRGWELLVSGHVLFYTQTRFREGWLVRRRLQRIGIISLALTMMVNAEVVLLQDGIPVRMRLGHTISSADAKTGDNVDFEVLDDVAVNGTVVIPRGSTALATITEAHSKKSMGRGGKLDVNIDYVRLPSGEKAALRGVQDAKAGGHVGAMTGAIVATSIVFFPAAPLFLFIKGKDITIPKGHEITVYTNGDQKIDTAKYPEVVSAVGTKTSMSSPAAKLSGKALTNADVLELIGAGISDALIMAKIGAAPADFQLDTSDLIALKKAGASDNVVGAMVEASKR